MFKYFRRLRDSLGSMPELGGDFMKSNQVKFLVLVIAIVSGFWTGVKSAHIQYGDTAFFYKSSNLFSTCSLMIWEPFLSNIEVTLSL